MKHFLEISQLSLDEVNQLITRAVYFKNSRIFPDFSRHRMANMFYENSTRTRVSFELAACNMSIPVVNLDVERSSETKGETLEDTLANLAAMGIDLVVIRHRQEGIQQQLAQRPGIAGIHLINAGDGIHAHPSQAMLDLMTVLEHRRDLSQLKIAIIGDILHSRVANSLQYLFALVGVKELTLVAPKPWQPKKAFFGRTTDSLEDGISNADVIICLRVQQERLLKHEYLDLSVYRSQYALSLQTLAWARPEVLIMHPGPVNRGVEIDGDVADSDKSVILQQVTNGVFMRSAIIESVLQE